MSNAKLKEKKKKARERDSKAKVLRRRAESRQKSKKERETSRLERKTRDRIKPIVNPKTKTARDIEIKSQLEHNIEILKALEEQYLEEQKHKSELNEQLESQGAATLKEKMDMMEQEKNKELGIDENYNYPELQEEFSKPPGEC